ncbi:cytochrome c oxidase subunit I [Croceicoccus marinus]|uniref:cytochrome-c oxidase n=1 Tax=Croceicoccus marinus TaxID=450378 RepID=A0A1Z1FD69_9SPHN|nr:cytochrome c oxidase subunit I [Croceicoccus marinus]ARU16663.1 cytochrome c oxidase subunit I [Croceicoccus marinus]
MKAIRLHRDLTRIWGNEPGWRGVFSSVSHTDLGKRFVVAAAVFFGIGGVLAMLIRAQLATPESAFAGPEVYGQIFTMHGSIMMFLFAIPMLEGLAIYLLPKILGARDLAYPRLTALGWWCYLFGGTIMILALLGGVAPDAGWFLYPPLSGKEYTPGVNSDVWLLGITFVEISAMCAAIEIVVTILKFRAANMGLTRMPIMAWYLLATAGMMVFGFPPLILGSILLEVERAFGWPFFQPEFGGSPLLWQHLFWLFGHPEVYIIFLPAAGALSTIIPVMARTPLIGYGAIVTAVMALAFLSFGLWVHHMFTTGIPHMALGFFSAASVLVAIPTAVQIFAWIGTIWAGRPKFTLPMYYILGFFVVFVLGGLTGVMLAIVPFDQQAHDTAFVTAHLHYVLVGGFVFPMLAAAYYWMPHATGRTRVMRLGIAAFWLIFIGFNLTFLHMHLTGLLGMPRRVYTYPAEAGWTWLNLISSIGSFMQAFGFGLFAIDIALQRRIGNHARRDPWDAETLEWAMPIPPTQYNFASLPTVDSREPLTRDRKIGAGLAAGKGLLGRAIDKRRETLAVDMVTGAPEHVAILPGPSLLPLFTAMVIGGFFLSMLLSLYWLTPLFVVGTAIMVWRWAGTTGTTRDPGPIDVGAGVMLPTSFAVGGSVGYWGSVLASAANGTLFASLVFGYFFLWVVAPNWPPPGEYGAYLLEPLLITAAAALALLGARMGQYDFGQASVGSALAAIGLALAIGGLLWAALHHLPGPTEHAFAAVGWVLTSYAIFSAAVGLLTQCFVRRRIASGHANAAWPHEFRIAAVWSDYGAGVTIVVAWLLALSGDAL